MVDRYLAWLNCNIDMLDTKAKGSAENSTHDKRRCRYKRDALVEAREQYLKASVEIAVGRVEEAQMVNFTANEDKCAGGANFKRIVRIRKVNNG